MAPWKTIKTKFYHQNIDTDQLCTNITLFKQSWQPYQCRRKPFDAISGFTESCHAITSWMCHLCEAIFATKTCRFKYGKSMARRGERWRAFIPWLRTSIVEIVHRFQRSMSNIREIIAHNKTGSNYMLLQDEFSFQRFSWK